MSNMSYCRFQNTLGDLRDCFDNMDVENLPEEELPDDKELSARKKIIKLCKEIAEEYENE